MATRPYVPRADGESSIGVVGKKWGKIYAYDIDEKTNLGNNKSLGYRQPSNAQTVGDVRYHATLPTGWYLECTTAGQTGSGALTITSPTVGGTVSDGTVTWTIRKNASTQDLTGYLPLSGGQLSGYIYGDSGKPLYFKAAPQADGGPSLALYGLDIQESQPIIGGFEIIAMGKDRTTTKSLLGYNNGNLTWCGNSIDKSAVVAESLGANGYRKYASGLIVQWGATKADTFEAYNGNYYKNVPLNITIPTVCVYVAASVNSFKELHKATAYCGDSSVSEITITCNTNGTYVVFWYVIGY